MLPVPNAPYWINFTSNNILVQGDNVSGATYNFKYATVSGVTNTINGLPTNQASIPCANQGN